MHFRRRLLARLGVVVLLASGALAAIAVPSSAAGTPADLELAVVGTKFAAGVPGKIGWARISNHGPGTPSALSVTVDLSQIDFTRLFSLPFTDNCAEHAAESTIVCAVEPTEIPGPGQTLDVPLFSLKNSDTDTYRGPVTYRIDSPDDSTPDNNTKTVTVTASAESGVDLGVWVPDVTERLDASLERLGPLLAGDRTFVTGMVYNSGDRTAAGVEIIVRLPVGVTFTETEDCQYGADNRTATCSYPDWWLGAASGADAGPVELAYPITVGAEVAGPINLCAGSWTVRALSSAPVDDRRARSVANALPTHARLIRVDEFDPDEVDSTDNVDGFSVIVHKEGQADSGNGCAEPDDGDGGGDGPGDGGGAGGDHGTGGGAGGDHGTGGGGAGGGLPVTGVRAGRIGGTGLALMIAGGLLVLFARRRMPLLDARGEGPTN